MGEGEKKNIEGETEMELDPRCSHNLLLIIISLAFAESERKAKFRTKARIRWRNPFLLWK